MKTEEEIILNPTTSAPRRKRGRPKKEESETIKTKNDELKEIKELQYNMRTQYGSEYNILGIGGCGTYILLGPTESGKTFLAEQLLAYAVCGSLKKSSRIKFHDYIVISSTARGTEDFRKVPLVGVDEIQIIEPTEQNFADILAIRKKEICSSVQELGLPETAEEQWAMDNPIVIVTDDTYGDLNMTTQNNPVAALVTKARHFGIYLIFCLQYVKQCGPIIKENARAVICLNSNYNNHHYMISNFFGYLVHKEELHAAVKFNTLPMHLVIYYLKWNLYKCQGTKKLFKLAAMRMFLLSPIKDYINRGFCHPEEDVFDVDSDSDGELSLIAKTKLLEPPRSY